jgi:hypothetical protein
MIETTLNYFHFIEMSDARFFFILKIEDILEVNFFLVAFPIDVKPVM